MLPPTLGSKRSTPTTFYMTANSPARLLLVTTACRPFSGNGSRGLSATKPEGLGAGRAARDFEASTAEGKQQADAITPTCADGEEWPADSFAILNDRRSNEEALL